MKNHQAGMVTLEFVIIGTIFFMVLFGVIEVGRLLFVWNSLAEATRRGARVAVVCPIGARAVANVAVFNAAASTSVNSPVIYNLSTSNILVRYLDKDGSPGGTAQTTQYVQVSITGYQHTLLIPLVNVTVSAPAFTVTLPRESLGADETC